MTPLPLLDWIGRARTTDPVESKEAAAKSKRRARSDCSRILAHLQSIYPRAQHFEEIADTLGMEPQDVGKRLSDLLTDHRNGLPGAVPTGIRRKTSKGANARTWIAS